MLGMVIDFEKLQVCTKNCTKIIDCVGKIIIKL
jgi:hypothetical protein